MGSAAVPLECGVDVRRVSIDAGHCPQDEAPRQVNAGLMAFAAELGAYRVCAFRIPGADPAWGVRVYSTVLNRECGRGVWPRVWWPRPTLYRRDP